MKNNLLTLCEVIFACFVFFGAVYSQTENGNNRENTVADKAIKAVSIQIAGSQLVDFSGEGSDEIFPSGEVWQPFGPNREITVKTGQKIVGFGSAVFGTTSGTGRIAIGLCYAKIGSKIFTALLDNNHLIADVDSSRRTFAVSASATLPAGTYSVGYCVINRGSQVINNNDYVNGWILVIN